MSFIFHYRHAQRAPDPDMPTTANTHASSHISLLKLFTGSETFLPTSCRGRGSPLEVIPLEGLQVSSNLQFYQQLYSVFPSLSAYESK